MTKQPKYPLHLEADPTIFGFAKKLRKTETQEEQILWKHLRGRKLMNIKFRRQHPLFQFVADFYSHELKLIIEIDGGYHNDEDVTYRDNNRDKLLHKFGIKTIRISNAQISNEIDKVISDLKQIITNRQNELSNK